MGRLRRLGFCEVIPLRSLDLTLKVNKEEGGGLKLGV
jgi:hypothetical protein